MRRVCFVVTGLHAHGAERMLFKLASHLDQSRFRPAVIALGARQDLAQRLEACGIPVHCLGIGKGLYAAVGAWRLRCAFQAPRPDVIQGVPAPIVWTRFCNSGCLSHGISLADFKG